jgi:hypothetical protein
MFTKKIINCILQILYILINFFKNESKKLDSQLAYANKNCNIKKVKVKVNVKYNFKSNKCNSLEGSYHKCNPSKELSNNHITKVCLIFANINFSFDSSIHNVKAINYFNAIIEHSKNGTFNTNLKITNEKYIITVDDYLYNDISFEILREFEKILESGRIDTYKFNFFNNKYGSQFKRLFNNLGGVNSEIILGSELLDNL